MTSIDTRLHRPVVLDPPPRSGNCLAYVVPAMAVVYGVLLGWAIKAGIDGIVAAQNLPVLW